MKSAVLAATLIVLFIAVAWDLLGVAICDGWYELNVEISEDSSSGITRVLYLPVNSPDYAAGVLARLDDNLDYMEERGTTEPFSVRVGFSFRASGFGRTWSHTQEYSDLIVVLKYGEDARVVHRVTIPHRDAFRHVVISDKNVVTH